MIYGRYTFVCIAYHDVKSSVTVLHYIYITELFMHVKLNFYQFYIIVMYIVAAKLLRGEFTFPNLQHLWIKILMSSHYDFYSVVFPLM